MAGPTTPLSFHVAVVLTVAAIAMMGTAIGTVYWLQASSYNVDIRFGLFELCVKDTCMEYTETAMSDYHLGKLDAPKGLCITAVVLYFVAFVIMGHLVFIQKMIVTSKNHGYSTLVLLIFAGILAFGGSGKFMDIHDFEEQVQWKYGYSLYLSSISGFVSIAAGIFSVIAYLNLFNAQNPSGGVGFQPPQQVAPSMVMTTNSYGYPPNVATVQYHPGPSVMVAPAKGYGMNQAAMEFQKALQLIETDTI